MSLDTWGWLVMTVVLGVWLGALFLVVRRK